MKKIKQSISFTVILLLLSIGAFSQTSTSKTEKIKTLMELTGSSKQYQQVMGVMLNSISKTSPNLPSGFFETFTKEINFADIVNAMVPIYEKHFTESDIDAMISFYQSETGKKMIEKMPLIMADYMPIVQEKVKLIMANLKKEKMEQADKTSAP